MLAEAGMDHTLSDVETACNSEVDAENLLQPDYSSFTLWSNQGDVLATRGAAEIWKTGAGVLLPALPALPAPSSSGSSDVTLLSTLTRRLSEQSLHSLRPFKSRYCESEPGLLSESTADKEPMLFVPSSTLSSAKTQRGKGKKKAAKKKRSSTSAGFVSIHPKKKLKARQQQAFSGETSDSKASFGAATGEGDRPAMSPADADGGEDFNRTSSAVSSIPLATRSTSQAQKEVTSKKRKATVLSSSSPNVPTKKASAKPCKLPRSLCKRSKPPLKRKDLPVRIAERGVPSTKEEGVAVRRNGQKSAATLRKGRSHKKAQKKWLPTKSLQVLTEWAQSDRVVPYPDKEVKQELADAAKITVHQVENWLAGARNRTHLIEVPEDIRQNIRSIRAKSRKQADAQTRSIQ